MRDYAYEDYGLVLDEATMKHICEKLHIEAEEDRYEYYGAALYEEDFCVDAGEFTGQAFALRDDGVDEVGDDISYFGDALYYVPFEKYPSLFNAPYKDINEIVEEFKSKVGEYMPNGYDYRANIRHIIGTTFG
jgi:hypothetical protein